MNSPEMMGKQWRRILAIVCLTFLAVLFSSFYSRGLSDNRLVPIKGAILPRKLLAPNIVFLLADDLGYGDVGYNGGLAETPNIDAMAAGKNSILLTRSYSGGPVCSPTRGTLLTGRNHNRYCIWSANAAGEKCSDENCPSSMPLPTTEITVAEILRRHGYRTALFGKWHVGDVKPLKGGHPVWPVSHPGMHGFDEWLVTMRSVATATPNCGCFKNASRSCVMGHYEGKKSSCRNYHFYSKKKNQVKSYPISITGDDSHFLFTKFHDFLKKVTEENKPFFIFLSFHAVHRLYIAVEPYKSRYTTLGYNAERSDYYGTITAMDVSIGRVRALLQQYNFSKNTLLWFTSDNGPEVNTPGSSGGLRGKKRSLHEGGIRVPGIIEWPEMIKSNRKSSYPVVTNDFLPTVCDILGVEVPKDRAIDGQSIMPLIQRRTVHRNSAIGFASGIHSGQFNTTSYAAALINNQYKLMLKYSGRQVVNTYLYDLKYDPGERENIAPTQSNMAASMSSELHRWMESVEDSAHRVGCLGVSGITPPCSCSV